MNLTPGLRRFALTVHITSTVGWLGAIAGFLALAVAALISKDVTLVRGAYLSMELIGWYVLVPLCIASLLTGLVMSLGTTWGLFRHYWVLAKFLITIVASVILFIYTQTLSYLGNLAANTNLSVDDLRNPSPVLHASAAVLALLVTTTLSVYKPRGLTAYGRHKKAERGTSKSVVQSTRETVDTGDERSRIPRLGPPRWVYVVGIHAVGLVLLFLVLHLTGGGVPGH